jgi:hypothetical protein
MESGRQKGKRHTAYAVYKLESAWWRIHASTCAGIHASKCSGMGTKQGTADCTCKLECGHYMNEAHAECSGQCRDAHRSTQANRPAVLKRFTTASNHPTQVPRPLDYANAQSCSHSMPAYLAQ